MQDEHVDGIIHLAAESHVDRSIKDPYTIAQTNVMGTLSLLQAAKLYWESLPEKFEGKRFYHISTDEVYDALQMTHPEGIEKTVKWYLENQEWMDNITSGDYMKYYSDMYDNR